MLSGIKIKVCACFGQLIIFSLFQAYSSQILAEPVSLPVVGRVFEYTVQPGDYLIKISARFGAAAKIIANENGLNYHALLRPGQKIMIDNRHIVPEIRKSGLLINIPQRMLYSFQDGLIEAAYPVGLGKPSWETPQGNFKVNSKKIDKTWYVPKSIQEEMREAGMPVKTLVQPGPDNPLGKYWLGLIPSAIGIHGTIAPASVYHFQSHGCIRLHPEDVESLFQQLDVGATCNIIYAPLLLTQLDGRVYLEVNRDIYKQSSVSLPVLTKLAVDTGLTNHIDWERAQAVLEEQAGLARDITLAN